MGENSEVISGKLEAIGFGFLVPIFFVVSGVHFDLHALVDKPSAVLRIPLFLVVFLLVRGVPAMVIYRKAMDRSDRVALALLSSTGLPLIVVITGIGVSTGRMRPEDAAALVAAGILSVVLYPIVGIRLLRPNRPGTEAQRAVESEPPPDLGETTTP